MAVHGKLVLTMDSKTTYIVQFALHMLVQYLNSDPILGWGKCKYGSNPYFKPYLLVLGHTTHVEC